MTISRSSFSVKVIGFFLCMWLQVVHKVKVILRRNAFTRVVCIRMKCVLVMFVVKNIFLKMEKVFVF